MTLTRTTSRRRGPRAPSRMSVVDGASAAASVEPSSRSEIFTLRRPRGQGALSSGAHERGGPQVGRAVAPAPGRTFEHVQSEDGSPREAHHLHRAQGHAGVPRRGGSGACWADPECRRDHPGRHVDGTRAVRCRASASRRTATARVLVATDAAGEGINLQRAHLMINYDLAVEPQPPRAALRPHPPHRPDGGAATSGTSSAAETREGQVFERLFAKLEEERDGARWASVFDVLGRVSFERAARCVRAACSRRCATARDPAVRARLDEVVDSIA